MIDCIDHINIVVTDLDGMIQFYTQVLGLRQTNRVTISGEWIDRVVGLVGTRADVVYLELPSGPRIELIRYISPPVDRPRDAAQSNSPGLRHFALRVRDIDALMKKLEHAGVRFFSAVQQVPSTQVQYASGVRKRLAYFQDPEQNLLEFCEYRE